MKTEIRTFCDAYAKTLEPFSAQLKQTLENFPQGKDDPAFESWRRRLQESSNRTETLRDKIAQQQAYVVIFGPLKSGKSTLMNAISGAYVSEVSSLPAYPALVYVRHSEQRAFQATTYSGKRIDFESREAMSEAVAKSHEELAKRILEAERAGETFDPQRHFPEAIRRLDVQAPARELAESGAALVDTPGLYTRMRFGYDAMARDFRDTASCAVFVVKSDNLFFERVFEEFNQLLNLFSRIFLVVNIDSSKRDLSPNGSLEPSLESKDPAAIVEAFQSLAMSAPLRQAQDEGRLNVYAVDLLDAASRRLGGPEKPEAEAAETAEAAEEEPSRDGQAPEQPAAAAEAEGRDDAFDPFVGDLADYLNSNDYVREFMDDSLRAGQAVHAEVATVAANEAAEKLGREEAEARRGLDEAKERLDALDGLDDVDWEAAFREARQEKDRLLSESAAADRGDLGGELVAALERWLDTDDTLRSLRDDYLNPLIERATSAETNKILERLSELLKAQGGGARFSARESRALAQAGLELDALAAEAFREVGVEEALASPGLELSPEDVPVKRSLLDCLLFRRRKTASKRLFGPEGGEFVAAKKKRKRLAGKPLEALRERARSFPESELAQVQRDRVDSAFDAYIERLRQAAQARREELRAELDGQRQEREATLKAVGEAKAVFERLLASAQAFGKTVETLSSRFAREPLAVEVEAGGGEESEEKEERLAVDAEKIDAARERLKDLPAEQEEAPAERER